MGRAEEKVSREKEKGNNTRQVVDIDFSTHDEFDEWLSDTPAPESVKKPVEKKATPKKELNSHKRERREAPEDKPLTPRQERFCQYYIEDYNGIQAAIKAGYSEKSAGMMASDTLRKPNVIKRIKELKDAAAKPHIATSEQVMQFFSDVMNGKIKDQFGLEASLADRTKAAIEIAKRTVDLDQKLAGKPDATVEIKLDWAR